MVVSDGWPEETTVTTEAAAAASVGRSLLEGEDEEKEEEGANSLSRMGSLEEEVEVEVVEEDPSSVEAEDEEEEEEGSNCGDCVKAKVEVEEGAEVELPMTKMFETTEEDESGELEVDTSEIPSVVVVVVIPPTTAFFFSSSFRSSWPLLFGTK